MFNGIFFFFFFWFAVVSVRVSLSRDGKKNENNNSRIKPGTFLWLAYSVYAIEFNSNSKMNNKTVFFCVCVKDANGEHKKKRREENIKTRTKLI